MIKLAIRRLLRQRNAV